MSAKENGIPPVTYFACTLGEAQDFNHGHIYFTSVSDLIKLQARDHPNDFAVGFPVPNDNGSDWNSEVFTFQDLRQASLSTQNVKEVLKNAAGKSKTIGLLCPSSVEFLISWLRLMKAGYSVLIIAPQCNPEAIVHLCKSCDVKLLLHHEMYSELADLTSRLPGARIETLELPWHANTLGDDDYIEEQRLDEIAEGTTPENDIAFIFHTSGTSNGLPKPIPQNQHGAVGILPTLNGRDSATFSTTPLYHGGIADCLRAWSSGAMIWLFPGAIIPITTKNILSCLSTAHDSTNTHNSPPVKYFSSVPYVLEMLFSEKAAIDVLKIMDMVGVGGAALSSNIGDELVEKGVTLLSRFGSAECGFLLSSHRDYNTDKEWQFLRPPVPTPYMKFEPQGDDSGLSELIILKGWPHMSKTNREDGCFATSDLFEPHPTIEGAWKYHSRSDSQIALVTGKKFDPAPVEEAIRSATVGVSDVVIVGEGRQEAGALIFRNNGMELGGFELEESLWEAVKHFNERGQAHTRISRDMIVIMPTGINGPEKSSKGTILRRKVYERFGEEIEQLYGGGGDENSQANIPGTQSDDEIKSCIRDIVLESVGQEKKVDDDSDFYRHGVDSSKCTKIRNELQKKITLIQNPLPWNLVYDCGTISGLFQYFIARKNGKISEDLRMAEQQYMLDLVSRYTKFNPAVPKTMNLPYSSFTSQSLVVLTGATGSLGAHILHILRSSSTTHQIICLVRATSHKEARLRVSKSLLARKKPPLKMANEKVLCVPSRLEDEDLGISPELIAYVKERVTFVIHAAWPVNFSIPLKSFEGQLKGLNNLLNLTLSCTSKTQFLFCSSTASVLGPNHPPKIPEIISTCPNESDVLGYSRSKWVAEAICSAASESKGMEERIKVLRIGQLTGDTENGVWNMSEAWPLMLSTVVAHGCLPWLNEALTWLPVDVAAKAVIEIALGESGQDVEEKGCSVYHLVNKHDKIRWCDLLGWIGRFKDFETVQLDEWLLKLEDLEQHPAQKLAWLWKKSGSPNSESKERKFEFDVQRAERASRAIRSVQPVTKELAGKIWNWLEEEISL